MFEKENFFSFLLCGTYVSFDPLLKVKMNKQSELFFFFEEKSRVNYNKKIKELKNNTKLKELIIHKPNQGPDRARSARGSHTFEPNPI